MRMPFLTVCSALAGMSRVAMVGWIRLPGLLRARWDASDRIALGGVSRGRSAARIRKARRYLETDRDDP